MRTTVILLIAVSISGQTSNAASVYKCKDEHGETVFSQTPCAPDAAKVEVQPISTVNRDGASAQTNAADYAAVTKRVSNRMIDVKIRNAKNRIKVLAEERDTRILEFRREMMRSAYNSAGVVRNQKYQELIEATREGYDARIASKRAEISDLQSQKK